MQCVSSACACCAQAAARILSLVTNSSFATAAHRPKRSGADHERFIFCLCKLESLTDISARVLWRNTELISESLSVLAAAHKRPAQSQTLSSPLRLQMNQR